MTITSMHRILLIHCWIEVDRIWSEDKIATVCERCKSCDEERRVLDLGSNHGTSGKGFFTTATPDSWQSSPEQSKRISNKMDKFLRAMDSMKEQIVRESDHDSIEDLITEIKERCQGGIDGYELPYSQLWRWIYKPKRYRVINLLPFFQGPVCNRCDSIFSPLVEPTVDHINGDRSNAHPCNLQLLCKGCNGKKGDGPTDKRDVSPFTYEGEVCEHKLSCVEFHDLQSAKEGATVKD